MASIISPASTSAASLFGVVTSSANVVTQTLTTVSRAVDMLDYKAKDLHNSVVADSVVNQATYIEDLIEDRAIDIVERKEARHVRMHGNKDGFDRVATYNAAVTQLTEALQAEEAKRNA